LEKKIDYKKSVIKDLKRIDHSFQVKLVNQLEKELSENAFAGKPLKGAYKGLFSLRIGDYRVIYTIAQKSVLVLRISHRKDVYDY